MNVDDKVLIKGDKNGYTVVSFRYHKQDANTQVLGASWASMNFKSIKKVTKHVRGLLNSWKQND